MKKYYAVFVGKSKTPIIFNNWEDCKEEVKGVKGAIYKSFKTLEDARNFILNNKNLKNENSNVNTGIYIYVDGSFSVDLGNYSYGFIVVKDGKEVYEESGVGENEKAIALRNVSGEVLGALKAVEYAIDNNYEEVTIVYDYQGISSWALGMWNRNNPITQNYYREMQLNMKKIKINFQKVKGHSGDKYNDIADKLAKKALGIIS